MQDYGRKLHKEGPGDYFFWNADKTGTSKILDVYQVYLGLQYR